MGFAGWGNTLVVRPIIPTCSGAACREAGKRARTPRGEGRKTDRQKLDGCWAEDGEAQGRAACFKAGKRLATKPAESPATA